MSLHCSFLDNRRSPLGAAHLEMPVLSSQCSANPDVFSFLSSASRNITRLRNCIYFCIWCIVVSSHTSSVWAPSIFPYKAVFHVLPLKHSKPPELWSCFYTEGWLEGFGRFLHLRLKTCPRICLTRSSGKGERSFLASWCRKTYWHLFMVGMSLAAGSGEKRGREI